MEKGRWWEEAACKDMYPEIFSVSVPKGIAQAKKICAGCPVKRVCLEETLRIEGTRPRDYREGIAGGMTPIERYNESLKRQRSKS